MVTITHNGVDRTQRNWLMGRACRYGAQAIRLATTRERRGVCTRSGSSLLLYSGAA